MAAITLTFTPANDTDVTFKSARISKEDAILLGMEYYNAPTVQAEDAIIEAHNAIMVRRSLLAFANYASRTGQPEVAKVAKAMRDEIIVLKGRAPKSA